MHYELSLTRRNTYFGWVIMISEFLPGGHMSDDKDALLWSWAFRAEWPLEASVLQDPSTLALCMEVTLYKPAT